MSPFRCALPAALVLLGTPSGLAQDRGRWIEHEVDSDCLAGNAWDFPSIREVLVYTPPGYDENADRRYPSVYVLHGIGAGARDFAGGSAPQVDLRTVLDREILAGRIPPAVYVVPDCHVVVGGIFYADSEVAGDWQTFLMEEVLFLVDDEYRTLDRPESRGILGHSMGGYGVLALGRQFPDVFGAVFSMSPATLAFIEELGPENPSWRRALRLQTQDAARRDKDFFTQAFLCIALAFSPNPERESLGVDWPFRLEGEAVVAVPEVVDRWKSRMLAHLPDDALRPYSRLRALHIEVGQQEEFPHILQGCRLLAERLRELDIPHASVEYQGGHNDRIWERMQSEALPFFARHLVSD